MKTLILGVVSALCLFLVACEERAAQGTKDTKVAKAKHTISFPAALQQAKEQNKFVLVEFTGSDWCPPCKMMEAKVLSQPPVEGYLKTNVVYVILDFPADLPQSEEEKKANEALAQQFSVEGFPTFLLVDADGQELWRQVGAFTDSPQEFISAVENGKKASPK